MTPVSRTRPPDRNHDPHAVLAALLCHPCLTVAEAEKIARRRSARSPDPRPDVRERVRPPLCPSGSSSDPLRK